MASAVDPTSKEASTATVTRSCLEEFQQCIQQLEGKDKIHIQTRLADLRLWADSVGATAQAKASLNWRFQHRPGDIYFIQGLLSMLEGFLKQCFIAANNRSDVRDILTNIDSTVDSLGFIGVQIRRSGRKSRLRRADDSFDQNRDKYRKLRAHLTCVVASKPTEKGRPKDEGKEIHSVDYFANLKLPPIQERLVEANLRRRHRFMEAQRHSHGLKDLSTKASYTVIPQQFITMAAIHTKQEVSPMQDKKVAAAMRQKQALPTGPGKDTPTTASGVDSKYGGLQNNRQPRSTVTRITGITAAARYPRAHTLSNPDQKLVKCPCCCQAIPATELEDSQWRKHVANDLCPYTCILENCPTPYNLFVAQKEWNDHVMNDHPPQWQCPCCEGDPPMFKSLSGITSHVMSKHLDVISDSLEDLLSDAEINVMGVTKCPLCDSEGPQDSPDLVEHVLQHVHDFSLRSLPWPMDPTISLDKPVGIFDMSQAVKIVKDDIGNEYIFHVAGWAETVVPTFDPGRGVKIVNDSEGNELVLDVAGWPENTTLDVELSLQLCDIDRNPPKDSEEESTLMAHSNEDYFSQNDYFMDESGDGRFSSQTSHSSQQTQDTVRSSGKHQPKKWICTLCSLLSMQGDDVYFRHLENIHPEAIEEAQKLADGDVGYWKRSMLNEAYWNGVEVISATSSRRLSLLSPEFDEDLDFYKAEILHNEIIRVHDRLPKIDFEDVNLDKRTVIASMNGPWGKDDTAIYIKVTIAFPDQYPKKAPTFTLSKTSLMSDVVYNKLRKEVQQIAAGFVSRKQGCLEAALCYLLGEIDLVTNTIFFKDVEDLDDDLVALASESSSDDEKASPSGLPRPRSRSLMGPTTGTFSYGGRIDVNVKKLPTTKELDKLENDKLVAERQIIRWKDRELDNMYDKEPVPPAMEEALARLETRFSDAKKIYEGELEDFCQRGVQDATVVDGRWTAQDFLDMFKAKTGRDLPPMGETKKTK